VNGQLSPALDFRASIHHVDAALIDAFVPNLLAQGTFNADAQLRGSKSAPIGHASFQMTGLKLANTATRGLAAVNALGSARFRVKTADVFAVDDEWPSSAQREGYRGSAGRRKVGCRADERHPGGSRRARRGHDHGESFGRRDRARAADPRSGAACERRPA